MISPRITAGPGDGEPTQSAVALVERDARPEAALIACCLAGDEASWEALISRYAGLINGVAARYGLGEHDRADIFQTVCLELWKSLSRIKEPARLPGWLVTVTARAAWALLRSRRALQQQFDSEDALAKVIDAETLPEDSVVLQERWATLVRAVQSLDPSCRELIWGLFFDPENPSYDELSARLSMSKNSIGPTRMRCLSKLRQNLETLFGSGIKEQL